MTIMLERENVIPMRQRRVYKSSALAIPTYNMSNFLLSDNLHTELESLMSNF